MTRKEVGKLYPGLYRIHWKDGGRSLAAVGLMHDGQRWCAPTNWTAAAVHVSAGHSPGGYGSPFWRTVARAELLRSRSDEDEA